MIISTGLITLAISHYTKQLLYLLFTFGLWHPELFFSFIDLQRIVDKGIEWKNLFIIGKFLTLRQTEFKVQDS